MICIKYRNKNWSDVKREFLDKVLVEGLSFNEYFNRAESKLKNLEENGVVATEENKYIYLKINNQRMSNRLKSFSPEPETIDIFRSLDNDMIWMVLVEDWCGDCAQILPVLSKLAELNPRIKLKFMPRDFYPEIMDLYLTNGARSIPKLVVMDGEGKELFQWGARPAEAQKVVDSAKAEGAGKEALKERLHLWYGRDRGKSVETEIVQLLKTL